MTDKIKIKGLCSTFGGPNDEGMKKTEGLALYEHHEADRRPDLFFPRDADPEIGTSKRLRPEAFYIAVRFDNRPELRSKWQWQQFIVKNPANGLAFVAYLVDWGPAKYTGRAVDTSPGLARALGVITDQEVEVLEI